MTGRVGDDGGLPARCPHDMRESSLEGGRGQVRAVIEFRDRGLREIARKLSRKGGQCSYSDCF